MSVEARQGLGLPVSAAEWDYFGIQIQTASAAWNGGMS